MKGKINSKKTANALKSAYQRFVLTNSVNPKLKRVTVHLKHCKYLLTSVELLHFADGNVKEYSHSFICRPGHSLFYHLSYCEPRYCEQRIRKNNLTCIKKSVLCITFTDPSADLSRWWITRSVKYPGLSRLQNTNMLSHISLSYSVPPPAPHSSITINKT